MLLVTSVRISGNFQVRQIIATASLYTRMTKIRICGEHACFCYIGVRIEGAMLERVSFIVSHTGASFH